MKQFFLALGCGLAASAAFLLAPSSPAIAGAKNAPDFGQGENPWQERELTREDLLPSLRLGADYLAAHQLPSGEFIYNNDPLGRCCTKHADRYSLIRHLGAVYALLRAHATEANSVWLDAAAKGLAFTERFVAAYGKHSAVVRGFGQAVNLGENGFFLIDLVLLDHLAKNSDHRALEKSLVGFLAENLTHDGPFATKEQWAEAQAVIGIAHYAQFVEADAAALAAASRWLEAGAIGNITSHWHLQAIEWLRATNSELTSPQVLASSLTGAHHILKGVFTGKDGKTTRFIGARRGKLLSCNSTSRAEGLIATYKSEMAQGHLEEASSLRHRIKEHLAFALQFQYGLPGNLYANDEETTRTAELYDLKGGLANDPRAMTVRIDFVAHHVRALAAWLELKTVPVAAGLAINDLEAVASLPAPAGP